MFLDMFIKNPAVTQHHCPTQIPFAAIPKNPFFGGAPEHKRGWFQIIQGEGRGLKHEIVRKKISKQPAPYQYVRFLFYRSEATLSVSTGQ